MKACGLGRPTCAKTSYAPAFACVRGAPVAHEVLFLFNTHCIRLCPAAEKLQISCRAGRVCPLLCPPVKAQSDEKPVSHRPVFSVSPPFPPGFFLHLFDIIHPSQRLYRELFTLSTGFSTPSPPERPSQLCTYPPSYPHASTEVPTFGRFGVIVDITQFCIPLPPSVKNAPPRKPRFPGRCIFSQPCSMERVA